MDGNDLGCVEEFPYLRPLNATSEQMNVEMLLNLLGLLDH